MTAAPQPTPSRMRRAAGWLARPINLLTVLAVVALLGFQLVAEFDVRRWVREVKAYRFERDVWSSRETEKLLRLLDDAVTGLDEVATAKLLTERLPGSSMAPWPHGQLVPDLPPFSRFYWSDPAHDWYVTVGFNENRFHYLDVEELTRPPAPRRPFAPVNRIVIPTLTLLAAWTASIVTLLVALLFLPGRARMLTGVALRLCAIAMASLPLWLSASPIFPRGVFMLAGAVTVVAAVWHAFAVRAKAPAGICASCQYDLRGNVSGICPECGTAVGTAATAAPPATKPSGGLA